MTFNCIFYLLVLLFISVCFINGQQSAKRIAIKALVPRSYCDINQLKLPTYKEEVRVWCSPTNAQSGSYLASNHRLCQVIRNDSVSEYQCVDGTWKLASNGRGYHRRQRRGFLGDLFKSVVCFVTFDGLEICEDSVPKIPPKYTVCPPPDVQSLYIAEQKQTTVQVTWTDPTAWDDKEVVSNKQVGGVKKNGPFKGFPNDGIQHQITYQAKDSDGQSDTCYFTFNVKYLTCSAAPTPINGKKVSCPDGYLYGGECTFDCNNGYEMTDSNTATCLLDETWDNSPTCQKIRCNTPFNITNGTVTCDSNKHEFDDDCIFTCDDGFKLNGPSKIICLANRTWSADSTEVNCVDDEPPIISCQSPQVFYADRGSFNTSVTWNDPTASDNVDSNPSIVQTSGPTQGDILAEGLHLVKYQANDTAGNSYPALSECTIAIEVKVIKCSTGPTDALNNSRFLLPNCSDTLFYNGVSCSLSCDLNLPLNGTDLMTCERDGNTDKGVWNWGSGEQPFCEVVTCPDIDPPLNGSLTTDSVNARPLHVMSCRSGFDIPSVGSDFVGRLTCQDSGTWYPLDAFPDCIVSILPWLNLPVELYYEGDCNDNATQTQIKEQVLVYLSGVQDDLDNSICPNIDTCKIEFLNVECGETSGRKRRSSSDSHVVRKRSNFIFINLAILKIWDQGDRSAPDTYLDISTDLDSIADVIDQDVHNGTVLNVPGITLQNDGVQTGTPNLACDTGYKVVTGSYSCKPCPPGTYLDSDTSYCEFCKIGEYMDHSGAIQCDICPEGYSTLITGAKDSNKCIKLCSQGYFSSTTMEPCSACPVGTYQSLHGQVSCNLCSVGKVAGKTSSVTENDCDFFDVLVNDISPEIMIGSFTANEISSFTISAWLKVQEETNKDAAISISDINGDVINIFVGNEISVQTGTGDVALTNTRLSSKSWRHVICGVDIGLGTLQLYVDGSLEVSETDIVLDTSRTLSTCNVSIVANSNGLYISGLVIYGHTLTQHEKTSLSQTCSGIPNNDAIFTMTGILPNIVDGIAIISPTTCDPIDECVNETCNNQTCVNMLNGFSCICHGGMTGDLCEIPPDHCLSSNCNQGVCLSGKDTYTCICNTGYTGSSCDTRIGNGGWSPWSDWSGCDVTCNGGLSFRERTCDNPIPSPGGNDCEGESTESVTCNEQACPSCTPLDRGYGTIVTCYKVSDTLQKCNTTCRKGLALPQGQVSFDEYTCGDSTNHKWLPLNKTQECVDVNRPDFLGTRATVSYDRSIAGSAQTSVISGVENNLAGAKCVSDGDCTVTAAVASGDQSRKRRASSTELTIDISIKLTDSGDLDLAGFLTNGTESTAMTELLGALTSINDIISFIENNTEEIFQVTVDGVEYTLDNTSADFVTTVTCPSGYAGADGLCAQCAAGTYLVEVECISCEVGTYQPLIGQSECLSCPSGYTTVTYGSAELSECSVPVEETENTDSSDDDSNDNDNEKKDQIDEGKGNATIIAAAVVSVLVILILTAIAGLVLWKKVLRKRFGKNETTGSFASFSMVRSSSSISDGGNNYRTQFNAERSLPVNTRQQVNTELDEIARKMDNHEYINHNFK